MEPKILLADDHSMIRKGIKLLCEMNLGYSQVEEATSCHELMKQLSKRKFTHLLLDINLSDGSTLEVLPNIRKLYPHLLITILSMQPFSVYERAINQLGIYQFISKSAPEADTIRLLRQFFRNEQPSRPIKGIKNESPFSSFTPRELEIMHYMLKGIATMEIAKNLNLKSNTISTVKNRIFVKTKTTNVIELKELADLYKIT
jgi:DNA-binding NarL/FixJ family response regulator